MAVESCIVLARAVDFTAGILGIGDIGLRRIVTEMPKAAADALRAADVFEITPLSSSSTSKADPLQDVFLVDGTGRLALNGTLIEQGEIEATITQHLVARPNKVVRLKADAGVPTAHIIRLMGIARDAGAEHIALLTLESSK